MQDPAPPLGPPFAPSLAPSLGPGQSAQPRMALVGASGWLGAFIGPALLRAGVTAPERFAAVYHRARSPAYDPWQDLEWAGSLQALAAPPEVVILSVRPQDFRRGQFPCPEALVISVMAGVPLEEVQARTGAARVIRAMPNALVETAQSYTPWLASSAATACDRALAQQVLRCVGTEAEVPDEHALDVLTTLSGAGPAFAALLAVALTEAGEAAGLSPEIARGAAENLVCGGAHLLAGRIATAPQLVQSFLEYDGVIAAGLRAARAAGFDDAVEAAVTAALAKVRGMNGQA